MGQLRKFCAKAAKTAAVAAVSAGLWTLNAQAEDVLRVAMTMSDIPTTNGQPNGGAEGHRFAGITIFDSLIAWDLTSVDRPSPLVGGLAESWSTNPDDRRVWTFNLRKGVKFHDGSDWNAQAAIWNFDKILKKDAPQYDERQAGQSYGVLNGVESYRAVDDHTLEVVTKSPDALFPYGLTVIFFASPAHWDAVGADWDAFSADPSGTGPWKVKDVVARERLELLPNPDYWDAARRPKLDRLVLLPIPDASARTAALLSGQVDWIEAPAPDSVERIAESGFTVTKGPYPHVWPWMLNTTEESPLHDVRVRQALNLGVDRAGIVELVGGLGYPAVGAVGPESPWFGNPEFDIRYDPDAARALMAEAGYSTENPAELDVIISASGSGQMLPLPMNEYIQQTLSEVGFKVNFEVLEWNALRARRNAGAKADENKGVDGINSSWVTTDPFFGFILMLDSGFAAPNGINFGHVNDPVIDELSEQIGVTFDPAEQDKLMAKLHARFVDQAYWLFVVHDANPRAMAANVKGFVSAQSWLQDLATVSLD
ncbi:ABC transporter substrate-binding protein [Pacificispira sp.]|uniref:ABC transporter substrate-binding protein n=1 Tax=Pacificispira sp. TaxID=2888761 RepID=UPI003BAA2FBD